VTLTHNLVTLLAVASILEEITRSYNQHRIYQHINAISSYTLKITLTIAHVTPHTNSSNYSSGNAALPFEPRKSKEVSSHSRILSYLIGMNHAQETHFYCCVAQTTQKTSHVIAISPVHCRADCCLATSYKYSSYCCVT
jgi:hypothetical protein